MDNYKDWSSEKVLDWLGEYLKNPSLHTKDNLYIYQELMSEWYKRVFGEKFTE